MNDKHPITPTPELVEQWWKDAQQANYSDGLPCWLNYIATQAARWGTDQELEACCGFIGCEHSVAWSSKLRAARRPKPLSLKEQSLGAWGRFTANEHTNADEMIRDFALIRRALEALPE